MKYVILFLLLFTVSCTRHVSNDIGVVISVVQEPSAIGARVILLQVNNERYTKQNYLYLAGDTVNVEFRKKIMPNSEFLVITSLLK